MARVEFSIQINGHGNSIEEAWADAVEGFTQEPGIAPGEHDVYCSECDQEVEDIDDLDENGDCKECIAEREAVEDQSQH